MSIDPANARVLVLLPRFYGKVGSQAARMGIIVKLATAHRQLTYLDCSTGTLHVVA